MISALIHSIEVSALTSSSPHSSQLFATTPSWRFRDPGFSKCLCQSGLRRLSGEKPKQTDSNFSLLRTKALQQGGDQLLIYSFIFLDQRRGCANSKRITAPSMGIILASVTLFRPRRVKCNSRAITHPMVDG